VTSTALQTDHYELTMLDAALAAGVADRPVVFEVFTRALPVDRRYGVFAGLGPLLDAIEEFRFGPEEIDWLAGRRFLSDRAIEWLEGYRFGGDIHAYPEGELYTGGSPVLTVCGGFGEAVLLETLVLSILNHDSAVAAAASLISAAAGSRPVIEMGSRRTDPSAAVAAARAAYVGGLASTSNLEAGRRYGIPTAGTAAHAFVLLFAEEREAFDAQVATLGGDTTLLVDTYDTAEAIRRAVESAGPGLGAIRIDSGDLGEEALKARELLDSLGAGGTRIVLTGDLGAEEIERLSTTPVDAFGAGTSVVTGGGHPTCGFIYKLVETEGRPVEKRSPGKETVGGRKWAWRVEDGSVDLVAVTPDAGDGRALQETVVEAGVRVVRAGASEARRRHAESRAALGDERALSLRRGVEPPVPPVPPVPT
jgi:nicotinate phosphoribosyltransferase